MLKQKIDNSPYANINKQSGLYLFNEGTNQLSFLRREEAYQSRLVGKLLSKIPEPNGKLGDVIKQIKEFYPRFERSYTGFLDNLRLDLAESIWENYEKAGYTFKTDPEIFKATADHINNITGRGELRSKLGKHGLNTLSPYLNIAFFSPRLQISRFQLLNPVYYARLPKPVRKMAMLDFAKFVGTGMALLKLSEVAGADIEWDPRSSDFLKIRVGQQRLNPFSSFQPMAVFVARMFNGETKTLSGNLRDINAKTFPYKTKWDYTLDFASSKFNPSAGLIRDWLKGKDFKGQEFDLGKSALDLMIPMYYEDLFTATKETQFLGFGLSIPGAFGISSQYYTNTNTKSDEMQSISNKQFEVSELKKKALETRSKEDVRAFREAQNELEVMRKQSKDYQNDLIDKRKKRQKEKMLLKQ